MDFNLHLNNWLKTPAGTYVRLWEEKHLDVLTADIFGFHAVQIGLPEINALHANRMPYRWLTNTYSTIKLYTSLEVPLVVVHSFSELPFAEHSLDLVVLPHVLELTTKPCEVLREVERVLTPGGQVIICGFNQTSLWSIRQMYSKFIGVSFLPQKSEFIHLLRLRNWLTLFNMEIKRGYFGCYVPPFLTKKWLYRFTFMEQIGDRWWPYFGALYIVQAVKRVKSMCVINQIIDHKKIECQLVYS